MFSIPEWDINASSETVTSHFFGSHSTNPTRKHKRKDKFTHTSKTIKDQQLPHAEVKKNRHRPIAPPSEKTKVKQIVIPMHNSVKNNQKYVNLRNVREDGSQNTSNSRPTIKFQSSICETRMGNFQPRKKKRKRSLSAVSDADLVESKVTKKVKEKLMSQKNLANKTKEVVQLRKWGPSDSRNVSQNAIKEKHSIPEIKVSNLQSYKKKRKHSLSNTSYIDLEENKSGRKKKRISSQHDRVLAQSNIRKKHVDEGNKEKSMEGNTRNHIKDRPNQKICVIDTETKNNEKHLDDHNKALTRKSPYNINKLKQLFAVSKESGSEKKQVKEPCSLRERMMKRLQASRFRYLNEQLYTTDGKDAKEYFQLDPKAFQAYHEGYQQQIQQWPINPLDVIITSLRKKSPELVIADFGCGDARLASSVPNQVHSFDLVALSPEVTACNMAHTPLASCSVDVTVFCLSLMGTNLAAYLTEANRVLKEGGLLKIAEVESRFENIETFIQKLQKFGFMCTWKDLSHNLFYFMDFKKERCISKKMKKKLPELTLKPCLYKKR